MSEQDIQGVNNVEETQQESTDTFNTSSPSVNKSEEAVRLEAQKAQLEAEIEGLEGTKQSLLDDVVRTRKEKRDAIEQPPQVDIEAMKTEIEESVLGKVSEDIAVLKEQLAQSKESEISAKKATIESINARMASASGSSGSSSPDSLVENEVEYSNEEKEVAALVGLQDPRYLKDTELRR